MNKNVPNGTKNVRNQRALNGTKNVSNQRAQNGLNFFSKASKNVLEGTHSLWPCLAFCYLAFYGLVWPFFWQNIDLIGLISSYLAVIDSNAF